MDKCSNCEKRAFCTSDLVSPFVDEQECSDFKEFDYPRIVASQVVRIEELQGEIKKLQNEAHSLKNDYEYHKNNYEEKIEILEANQTPFIPTYLGLVIHYYLVNEEEFPDWLLYLMKDCESVILHAMLSRDEKTLDFWGFEEKPSKNLYCIWLNYKDEDGYRGYYVSEGEYRFWYNVDKDIQKGYTYGEEFDKIEKIFIEEEK